MIGNIVRLAELLQKDTLTKAERREGINLTQSMFGTTAYSHRDHTLVALRRKKTDGANDPTGAVARASHHVVGVVTGNGQVSGAEAEQLDGLAAGAFVLNGDTYETKEDAAGRTFYTKNGKRIKNADFAAAQAELDGDADES